MKKQNTNSILQLNKSTVALINPSKIIGGELSKQVADSIAIIGKDTLIVSPKIKI